MQAVSAASGVFGLLNPGGEEIVLILAIILILFASKPLPLLVRGLGRGVAEFRAALMSVISEIRTGSYEAGRSLGGIYGKPTAQAITPENQVAEVYNPAVFGPKSRPGHRFPKFIMVILARTYIWVRQLTEAIRELRDKK